MTKVPLHTNIQTGLEWVQYILTGHEKKCRRNFRKSSYVFRQLCDTLRQYGYYGTRSVCVEESLAMTLMYLVMLRVTEWYKKDFNTRVRVH